MKISLEHISKRFQKHWIFKNISYTFEGPGGYAILGANGSGKSTLLRILAGIQAPSRGSIIYNGEKAASIFGQVSLCAPGMDIVEELTLKEFLEFHFSFKKPLSSLTTGEIMFYSLIFSIYVI